jgi:hypothetical protein
MGAPWVSPVRSDHSFAIVFNLLGHKFYFYQGHD